MKANVISNNEVKRIGITMMSPKIRWEVQSGQTNRVSFRNDENCDTKNETKQVPKGQTSTRFGVVDIRERTLILSESVKKGKGRLPNVG